MDKEQFLNLLNSNNYIQILFEYCIEKGKTKEETEQFIQVLSMIDLTKQMITSCINTAIQYYKIKFEIITISLIKTGDILINY